MPPVHNRIKSTLAQKSRTQATSNQNADAAADTDAAPATPVIPAKVPMDPVHAEAVPPKKKVTFYLLSCHSSTEATPIASSWQAPQVRRDRSFF